MADFRRLLNAVNNELLETPPDDAGEVCAAAGCERPVENLGGTEPGVDFMAGPPTSQYSFEGVGALGTDV